MPYYACTSVVDMPRRIAALADMPRRIAALADRPLDLQSAEHTLQNF
jgi:hypothetical protein